MFIRAIKPFYVSFDLICLGQRLDISESSATLYVARGDAEYLAPEQAVMPPIRNCHTLQSTSEAEGISMITLALVTPPAQEPVTLAQAKTQLSLESSFTDDDALIAIYVQAAREYVESNCNRAVLSQQWRLSLDGFPVYSAGKIRFNDRSSYWQISNQWAEALYIHLPKPSLISVDAITWIDASATPQTMDPTAYIVDSDTIPGRIAPKPNTNWPIPQIYRPNCVQVLFTCGYGSDPSDVPARVQAAMLLLISHWYANRESASAMNLTSIPFGIDALLASERFDTFGLGN